MVMLLFFACAQSHSTYTDKGNITLTLVKNRVSTDHLVGAAGSSAVKARVVFSSGRSPVSFAAGGEAGSVTLKNNSTA
ncbi:hypothetical protein ACI4BE_30250, partial [Klebsiella pneumoniae]|uniref:hypothetical protein n=1 Tax=Klebsiella pneumoniae TaxID=573 RepID=UPI003853528C